MKKAPNLWSLRGLCEHVTNGPQSSVDGKSYVPGRPIGLHSIGHRLGMAWLVFTGRADALVWPQGQ